MKNEKNFYDIINSKFNERETPFEEENWQAMRAMINASRSSERRTIWLVASLSLLLIAGGAFSLYKWNTGSGKSNNTISVTNSPKATKTNSSPQAETANTELASNNNQPDVTNNTPTNKNQPISNGHGQKQIATNTSTYQKKTAENNKHISKQSTPGIASDNTNSSESTEQSNGVAQIASHNDIASNSTKTESGNSTPTTQKALPISSTPAIQATASVAKTTGHKADSATLAATMPERFSNEPRVFGGKTNLFSAELGTEYSLGWQSGAAIQGKGYNVIAGIGYSHYLGAKWFLKTGLQFSTFGNMSPFTFNYQHSVGKVIYDSVITTKRLYFLRVPVQLEYCFGRQKKSIVGFGGSVWFLLGNSGFATTYEQVDNNPPINVVQYNQNAELKGYSEVNASAHFLYRYILSRKFSIYGILYYEITNMKDNSFFGENIVHRTRGFQITTSYNLN